MTLIKQIENMTLIKQIENWLKDYQFSFPNNLAPDYDEHTLEGSAALLLQAALQELKKKQ